MLNPNPKSDLTHNSDPNPNLAQNVPHISFTKTCPHNIDKPEKHTHLCSPKNYCYPFFAPCPLTKLNCASIIYLFIFWHFCATAPCSMHVKWHDCDHEVDYCTPCFFGSLTGTVVSILMRHIHQKYTTYHTWPLEGTNYTCDLWKLPLHHG